jgi:hypothetical protein
MHTQKKQKKEKKRPFMYLVVYLVFSFTVFVLAELQNLEFAACCAPVVCFVSARLSTVALS